jgi:hypothetical protein
MKSYSIFSPGAAKKAIKIVKFEETLNPSILTTTFDSGSLRSFYSMMKELFRFYLLFVTLSLSLFSSLRALGLFLCLKKTF